MEPSIKKEQAYIKELDIKIDDLNELIKKREAEIKSKDSDDRFNSAILLITKDYEKVIEKFQSKVRQNG